MTVGGFRRQVKGNPVCLSAAQELHVGSLRQAHSLNHIQVFAVHLNHVTALVSGLFGLYNGRLTHHQVGSRVDVVGNGVLVFNLIHIGKDHRTGNGIVRNLYLEFVTGLAYEFRSHGGFFTAEDNLLHVVQVLTLESEYVTGKNRSGREGRNLDRFAEGEVKAGAGAQTVFGDDGHFAHFGSLQGNYHADFAFGAGFHHHNIRYGYVTGKLHGSNLIYVATQNAEFTTPHDGVRCQGAECHTLSVLVRVKLILFAGHQGGGAKRDKCKIFQYLFHIRF